MDEEIKKLLEKNLKLTEEIHKMTKGIKSYVLWERIFGALKILFIVAPIVLGIIYLPTILEKTLEPYKELLNMDGANGQINLDDLSPNLLEKLKANK